MPNYYEEEIKGFIKAKKKGSRQTPKKANTAVFSFFVEEDNGNKKQCKAFSTRHAILPKDQDSRVYCGVCTDGYDCSKEAPQPKLTLANDSPMDHQLAKLYLLKQFASLDEKKDKSMFKKLRTKTLRTSKKAKEEFTAVVKTELKKRFDVGRDFIDDSTRAARSLNWDLIQFQKQLLAYVNAFGGVRRPNVANLRTILERHDEMLQVVLSRGYTADQGTMVDYMLKVDERAEELGKEMGEIRKRLDGQEQRLDGHDKLLVDIFARLGRLETGNAAAQEGKDEEASFPWQRGNLLQSKVTLEQQKRLEVALDKHAEQAVTKFVLGKDFHRLGSDARENDDSGAWLNDVLINEFFSLLHARGAQMEQEGATEAPRCHFFNSHFFPMLFKAGKINYGLVESWTNGIDIFGFDYVFIPINKQQVHWALAVIDVKKTTVKAYDSCGSVCRKPYLKAVLEYLKKEHKAKKKNTELPAVWHCTDTMFDNDIPRQENGYDCGVFVCLYAYFLSLGHALPFNQKSVYDGEARKKIAISILDGKVA